MRPLIWGDLWEQRLLTALCLWRFYRQWKDCFSLFITDEYVIRQSMLCCWRSVSWPVCFTVQGVFLLQDKQYQVSPYNDMFTGGYSSFQTLSADRVFFSFFSHLITIYETVSVHISTQNIYYSMKAFFLTNLLIIYCIYSNWNFKALKQMHLLNGLFHLLGHNYRWTQG